MTVLLVVLGAALFATIVGVMAHEIVTLRESLRAASRRESELTAEIQMLRAEAATSDGVLVGRKFRTRVVGDTGAALLLGLIVGAAVATGTRRITA